MLLGKQLKQLGGIVKRLALLVGVLVVGCMVCTIDEEPEVIEFTGSAVVAIEGELNGEPNMVTGQLMLGLAKGLTDGNCWGGETDAYITGTWKSLPFTPVYKSLIWRNAPGLGEITLVGGNGSCDSVIYVGITKRWPYPNWPSGSWYTLWEAEVGRIESGVIEIYNPIAEQEPHGSFGDSVYYGDYVQISWEITAHVFDTTGVSNWGTAQLAYDLAQGIGYDNMPYGLYIDFIYNNADTSRRTVSAETWASNDTTETRAIFTAQDTVRDRANDTLYGIRLVNSQSGFTAYDTTNRYVPTNKAVQFIETIYLVKWPGL
jgi:hypothetical protein